MIIFKQVDGASYTAFPAWPVLMSFYINWTVLSNILHLISMILVYSDCMPYSNNKISNEASNDYNDPFTFVSDILMFL